MLIVAAAADLSQPAGTNLRLQSSDVQLPLQILFLKNTAGETICQLSKPTVQSVISRLFFPLLQLSEWEEQRQ